ncbi:hypothetical protein B9Z19DRAFT_432807 [Tuber borchii]|uniref:Uncharacterized protein n=1 Tax=Tuber borchii TaxID=42251 RepID=A0A2T6ZGH5_TUBBO|nr:hypothetical protein B9Z19DRAFT_432807 [Tuber borchii]
MYPVPALLTACTSTSLEQKVIGKKVASCNQFFSNHLPSHPGTCIINFFFFLLFFLFFLFFFFFPDPPHSLVRFLLFLPFFISFFQTG